MSNEMTDRVARAIKDCGAYTPDWQGADEDLIIMARAAIAAMREPTEAMKEAAADLHSQESACATDYGFNADPDAMGNIFRAMIDAALNSKS